MQSKDIYAEMTERQIKLSGGILSVAFIPDDKKYKIFKRALFDYTCEKLSADSENSVIVEEISGIFHRLDSQFTSTDEKEKFYENYVHYILSMYGNITGKNYLWCINNNTTTPRIVDGYLETNDSMPTEDTAIWLFRELEQAASEKFGSLGKDSKQKIKK